LNYYSVPARASDWRQEIDMSVLAETTRIVLIGVGATAVMDLWLLILKRLGVATLDFAFVGRWIGHLARGQWMHAAITKAPPLSGERALGWVTHYAVGVAFAAAIVGICGIDWARHPSLLPAICIGIATVALPLFVMQPAMGAGFASSKTPTPARNCLKSLATHAVFGAGLYLAAVGVNWAAR
jgi:hypothetical protein